MAIEVEFAAELVEWRGPAPYVFLPLPPDVADLVDEVKAEVVYWGVVPVRAWIGDTEFTTSMFPREGTWFLPVKVAVRRAEEVELGDVVDVRLHVGRDA
jgi:leucyl aminopeptidase (aminopeptidase T)